MSNYKVNNKVYPPLSQEIEHHQHVRDPECLFYVAPSLSSSLHVQVNHYSDFMVIKSLPFFIVLPITQELLHSMG